MPGSYGFLLVELYNLNDIFNRYNIKYIIDKRYKNKYFIINRGFKNGK